MVIKLEKKSYRTPGRQKLIRFLSDNPDCQFTTEELCLAVNGTTELGKSSVYRHLSALCDSEMVRRFRSEERRCSVYQYVGKGCDCGNHFHAKCVSCGKIQHLDCGESDEFTQHLLTEHGFAVSCGQSILYGLCADCRTRKENDHA